MFDGEYLASAEATIFVWEAMRALPTKDIRVLNPR